MYKFTNGIVVFDKKTADSYIKAGYKLVEEKKKIEKEEKEKIEIEKEVIEDEENNTDGAFSKEYIRDHKKHR